MPKILHTCKLMVSAPGIAASNFAHGHAVASNLAKYDL
jgi:hypothetical protein